MLCHHINLQYMSTTTTNDPYHTTGQTGHHGPLVQTGQTGFEPWVFFLFSYSFFIYLLTLHLQLDHGYHDYNDDEQSPTQQLGRTGLVWAQVMYSLCFLSFFLLTNDLLHRLHLQGLWQWTAPTPHTQPPLLGQPPQGQPPHHTMHPHQLWHVHPLPLPAHGHVKICLPTTTTMCSRVHQWQETGQWDWPPHHHPWTLLLTNAMTNNNEGMLTWTKQRVEGDGDD